MSKSIAHRIVLEDPQIWFMVKTEGRRSCLCRTHDSAVNVLARRKKGEIVEVFAGTPLRSQP